ncbi:MAG: hypothetical protein E7649_07730 [Ruminococcaceae bacterium]|nr:hypothetical protein [Oscillospiraceae bacterium]
MIKQKWTVTIQDTEHNVEYKCSALVGKTVLVVDGDTFTVKGKPFGIGLERREVILVGGSRAILDVKRGGRALLICDEGEIKEA